MYIYIHIYIYISISIYLSISITIYIYVSISIYDVIKIHTFAWSWMFLHDAKVARPWKSSWYLKKTRRRPGLSPSMQHLVFWPHAGAWGARVILPPCAQLLWCRVVCYEEFTKKKEQKKRTHIFRSISKQG